MAEGIPAVSIIIPHWNGIETLSECLDSLKLSTYQNIEIIISDNASTDGSQDWLKENHPDILLLEHDDNYGYAGGCNRGALAASGSFLLFLNNDTIQEPGWLEPLVERIESDSSIAALQPKILNYYERDLFDYAGGCGGHMDIFCFPFARGRLFLDQEKDIGQYNSAESCFWASGTAIMVRRELFEIVGSFDEIFFSHMEEIDLCWRMQAMGYKIWVEPQSIVYHKNAVSMPMYSHWKYYLNHRNSLLMLLSNYTIPVTFYVGIIRLMLEVVALGYAVVKLDINHIAGILRALGWILIHPHTIVNKRKHARKHRRLQDRKIMKNMLNGSIALAYYLFGKKTYSEIKSKAS